MDYKKLKVVQVHKKFGLELNQHHLQMFGSGNEPSKEWCDKNLNRYIEYSESGIKTPTIQEILVIMM